jgi:3-oxoacyl-[acyl-carrier protein] reductase
MPEAAEKSPAGLLAQKVAVITGGASGLGWVMANRFADEGARIVIADIRGDVAGQRAAELRARGAVALAGTCDVTIEEDVQALVDQCLAAFGVLDVFVNNAGLTRDAVMRKMTASDFDLIMGVHLKGAWLGTRAATSAMRSTATGGSIINMSSISGKVGNPGQTNYSAAKAGMVGLTKASAKEVARYGIRVNAIQPGLIRTAMTEKMDQEALATGIAQVPLGRIGEAEEVAKVALFLASDLSSYMTGTVLEVTGGRHM